MAVDPLILVANPGSASRKYALFKRGKQKASLHIEYEGNKLVAHVDIDNNKLTKKLATKNLSDIASTLPELFGEAANDVAVIAVRIVAPSAHFLEDRVINDYELKKLEALMEVAPLHIKATLDEVKSLKKQFKGTPIVGVSDSAFHATKPDYAWNYGISLKDADRFDIKRFGYHGISLESVVSALKKSKYGLPVKTVICHVGSGVSVSAIYAGKSIETTMGYSPLEGVMMSTRSGTLGLSVGLSLAKQKKITPDELVSQLNSKSGLLGISGSSSDIRELLVKESKGDYGADLALSMYVYSLRQAIATMAAAMQGIDVLVFTGTVGQRSVPIRRRVVDGLGYLNIAITDMQNDVCTDPEEITPIHPRTRMKPVLVVPTKEEHTMARRARKLIT